MSLPLDVQAAKGRFGKGADFGSQACKGTDFAAESVTTPLFSPWRGCFWSKLIMVRRHQCDGTRIAHVSHSGLM